MMHLSTPSLLSPSEPKPISKAYSFWIGAVGAILAATTVALMTTAAPLGSMVSTYSAERIAALQVMVTEHRKDTLIKYLAAKFRKPEDHVRLYVELAWAEAARHSDVTPELLLAVMQKESSLRSWIKNSYGAEGLMQVVRRYHPEKLETSESLLDARVNIRVGAEILQEYITLNDGNLEKALDKYSAKATDYVTKITSEMENLRQL